VTVDDLVSGVPGLDTIDPRLLSRVAIDGNRPPGFSLFGIYLIFFGGHLPFLGRYSPFLKRQESDLKVFHEDESLTLDREIDYSLIEGLSSEVRERLEKVRPVNIVSIRADRNLRNYAEG
jgi:hypothetical protein